MSEDVRKQWFCERILTFLMENDRKLLNAPLNLDGVEDNHQFDNFLDADDDIASGDIRRRIFTVYKTSYKATVTEEIILDEDVQQGPSHSSQLEEKKKDRKGKSKKKGKKVGKQELEENDNDEGLVDASRSSKKKKVQKIDGRVSPYTMMEKFQPDDRVDRPAIPSMSPTKKFVEKVVELPRIQCMYGAVVQEKLESAVCCVYFIKKHNHLIPLYENIQEANTDMSAHFYVGSLGENFLEDLELMSMAVFLPLFISRNVAFEIPALAEDNGRSRLEVTSKDAKGKVAAKNKPSRNFVNFKCGNHVNKYLSAARGQNVPTKNPDFDFTEEFYFLRRTLKWASTGLRERTQPLTYHPHEIDVLLEQTDINNDGNNQEILDSLNKWIESLDIFISDNSQSLNFPIKISSEQKLLDEFHFWEETEVKLANVTDILRGHMVTRIMRKLQKNTDYAFLCAAIESKRITLYQLLMEASENADILRTHRPSFETLTSGDFKAMTKIIPRYINSLKSAWMLSKYYGEEKNMLRLLQNTRRTLCYRIKTEFDITVLFSYSWGELNEKLGMAKNMLQTWKTSYLDTRHSIESNVEFFIPRWEFEKSTLFSETEYITNVLRDLIDILKAVKQYQNLFEFYDCGNECKNLQRKTQNLTSAIEKVDFDIYLDIFRDEWLELLGTFQQNMVEMDQHLKILIIKTFSQIKAFDESIETIKNISRIETRPTIHDSLPYMCNKVTLHFIKQVKTFDQSFEKNRESHLVKRYKVCDFTSWAENLLKGIIQQMCALKSMINTVAISVPVFMEATECYNELECKIRRDLSSVMKTWISDVTQLMKSTLTDTVLEIKKADSTNTAGNESVFELSNPFETEKVTSINTLKWIMKAKLSTKAGKNKNASDIVTENRSKSRKKRKNSLSKLPPGWLYVESGYKFKPKLKPEIFDIIEHFYRLNSNGSVPSDMKILSFTIDSLRVNIEKIESALAKYSKIVGELNPNEITLLKEYLVEIERVLHPGTVHLTWKCSGIDDYCENIDTKCEEVAFIIRQVKKTLHRLDSFVTDIRNINFFPIQEISSSDLAYDEFIEYTKIKKRENIKKCRLHYEMISQTLIQLESFVLYTHSGKSPSMVEYYKQYSERISRALTEAVLRSIENLKTLFDGLFAVHFNVRCYLEKNQIKIRPPCEKIFESIKITMIEFFLELECLKFWDADSAITTRNFHGNALVIHKISEDDQVKSTCASVLSSLHELCDKMNDSMTIWNKYSIIWQYNKDESVAYFASTENPNLGRYEMVYNFYSDIEKKIDQENRISSICCVNIDAGELVLQLMFHCNQWKTKLSAQLASDTRTIISILSERIPKLSRSLDTEINGVQDLTYVLTTMNEIHDMEIDTDIQLYTIGEYLHELEMQNFEVNQPLFQSFVTLKSSWKILLRACSCRKFMLESVAWQMIPDVKSQISKFTDDCRLAKEELDQKLPLINALSFDDRLKWIRAAVKRQYELDSELKKLQHLSNCYEVIFPETTEFVDIGEKLNSIKQEYKVFQCDV